MQYNGESNNQDICTLADKFAKTDDTSFSLEEKTLYANLGSRLIMHEAHKSTGAWKYDDKNQTDIPLATTNLVSGQRLYTLPVDSSFIEGVYYLNNDGNVWEKVHPISLQEIPEAEPEFENDNGIPRYYRLIGDQIKLYPASNYNETDGLQIAYSRDISTFSTTDTTKTPGWDQQFHDILAIYMAYQYELSNHITTPTGKVPHEEQWVNALEQFRKHYSMKFNEMFPPRIKVDYKFNDYI